MLHVGPQTAFECMHGLSTSIFLQVSISHAVQTVLPLVWRSQEPGLAEKQARLRKDLKAKAKEACGLGVGSPNLLLHGVL